MCVCVLLDSRYSRTMFMELCKDSLKEKKGGPSTVAAAAAATREYLCATKAGFYLFFFKDRLIEGVVVVPFEKYFNRMDGWMDGWIETLF